MTEKNRNGVVALWVGTAASVATLLLSPAISAGLNPAGASPTPAPRNQIWYNRLTGHYHLTHCRFYMQTKEGMMLTLPEAQRLGHACATCFNPPRARKEPRAKGDVEKRILLVQ